MKNRIILCLGCLLAFLQLRAQVNTNQQHLCNPNSFSIVLLGDPQNYVKYDYNQPVFELMTAWTAHHIDSLRVKAVLCTGATAHPKNASRRSIRRICISAT